METITIIQHDDWLGLAMRKAGAKILKFPKQSFHFGIEADWHLVKYLEKDPLLHAKLTEPGTKHWQDLIASMADSIKKKEYEVGMDVAEFCNGPGHVKKLLTLAKADIEGTAQAHFDKYKKLMQADTKAEIKKMYKKYDDLCKYRAGVICRGAMRVGGVVLSISGLIKSAGTNGLAWWGLAKSCVSISNAVRNSAKDISAVQKDIAATASVLATRIDKHPKWAKTRELSSVVMPTLIGKEFGNSMSKLSTQLKVHKQKRLVLWKSQHNLAMELAKTLTALDKDKMKHPNYAKKFEKMTKKATDAMDRIAKMEKKLKEAEKFEADTQAALAKLNKKCSVKNMKAVARTLVVLSMIAKGLALDLSADESGFKALGEMFKEGDDAKNGIEANAKALEGMKVA